MLKDRRGRSSLKSDKETAQPKLHDGSADNVKRSTEWATKARHRTEGHGNHLGASRVFRDADQTHLLFPILRRTHWLKMICNSWFTLMWMLRSLSHWRHTHTHYTQFTHACIKHTSVEDSICKTHSTHNIQLTKTHPAQFTHNLFHTNYIQHRLTWHIHNTHTQHVKHICIQHVQHMHNTHMHATHRHMHLKYWIEHL